MIPEKQIMTGDVDKFRTYEFNQSEILTMMGGTVKGTAAAKGICQELCWKWMKRMRTKTDKYSTSKGRMDALWKDSTVNKAIDRHNKATQLSVPQDFYNIPKNNYQSKWGYDKGMIDNWRLKGGGLFISVACPKYKNEKHAISFYTPASITNTAVFFFDPNEGEYQLKFGDFYKFLPDFLENKYWAKISDIVEIVVYGDPKQVGKG